MSPRTNQVEVREIAPDIPDSLSIDPFIAAATLVVDRVAASCGSDFSNALLREIERWYSAHLAAVASPILVREKFEGADNTYQRGTVGKGVMSTQYGQMANDLSNGCLEEVSLRTPQIVFSP